MIERRRERGYALVLVLVVLLAATATGHSLLVLARAELSVSIALWADLGRRLAAESGVRIASRAVSDVASVPGHSWTPVASGDIPPRARFVVQGLRLGPEIVLLRSEADIRSVPGRRAVMRPFWGLDAVTRVGGASAVVEADGGVYLADGGGIDQGSLTRTPEPWDEASCARYHIALDTLFSSGLDPSGPLSGGRAGRPVLVTPREAEHERLPALGLLEHEALLARAALPVSGTLSPAPARRGALCDRTVVTNWGTPTPPLGPCSSYLPVVGAQGSLLMDGGIGQGVLLVSGDATLSSGALYVGLVWVSGDLTLRDGAKIYGLVRARGSVSVIGGSEVVGSACAALTALDAAESFHRLLAVPMSSWIDDPDS